VGGGDDSDELPRPPAAAGCELGTNSYGPSISRNINICKQKRCFDYYGTLRGEGEHMCVRVAKAAKGRRLPVPERLKRLIEALPEDAKVEKKAKKVKPRSRPGPDERQRPSF